MLRASIALIVVASALGLPARVPLAAPPAQTVDLVLTNANLIDGSGALIGANATVVVNEGTITEILAAGATGPDAAVRLNLEGRYLLPGLIDAHVHVGSFDTARRALHSGVTTARSMGVSNFADVGLRDLAAAGAIEAPEVLAAGYHVRPRPADQFFMDFPELAGLLQSGVRGPDALRRMGEALLSRGVDFIKANATERAGLPETDPRRPFYGEDELHALVETAASRGVGVAAHAHGDEGGRAAVAAGVRSVEHGTYLSEDTLRLMAERGTFLVPTIAVVFDLTQPGGDYDDAALQVRGRHMLPRIRETAANAHRLGVPLVAATDTGYGPGSTVRLQHELIELVGIGMTPAEAIAAATGVAAGLLGIADRTGSIAAGLEADLIAVERDPASDIGALQDVLLIINNGQVVVDRLSF